MKKLLLIGFSYCLFLFVGSNQLVTAQEETTPYQTKVFTFTKDQQAELNKLHQQILSNKKELVEKYVEYGALSQSQADKMMEHFEKHYEMMKKHNFQFPAHHPHPKHH